ncbi:hypothetical protein [Paenibacillus odorifer]|uniref:hypothetical protein n=1 Tax=Paenibacillus odorifer TaxID=189426 RepID=UPI0019551AD0|nr:hypothetical protein [Paenibacillus odorifer]
MNIIQRYRTTNDYDSEATVVRNRVTIQQAVTTAKNAKQRSSSNRRIAACRLSHTMKKHLWTTPTFHLIRYLTEHSPQAD